MRVSDSIKNSNRARENSSGCSPIGVVAKQFSKAKCEGKAVGDEPVVPSMSTSSVAVQRLLYDKRTAAEMLSISLRSLNYLLSRGEIRFRRIGSRVLIPHGDLVRFAHGHHPQPVAGD